MWIVPLYKVAFKPIIFRVSKEMVLNVTKSISF